jgi:hypothetical protein
MSDFLSWNSGLVSPLVIYGSFCDLNESTVRFVSVWILKSLDKFLAGFPKHAEFPLPILKLSSFPRDLFHRPCLQTNFFIVGASSSLPLPITNLR